MVILLPKKSFLVVENYIYVVLELRILRELGIPSSRTRSQDRAVWYQLSMFLLSAHVFG